MACCGSGCASTSVVGDFVGSLIIESSLRQFLGVCDEALYGLGGVVIGQCSQSSG